MRLAYFLAWHEAVSAAIPDDAAFSLVCFHCWTAGGVGGRTARGRVPLATTTAAAVAAAAVVPGHGDPDGLLGNMQRMHMSQEPHNRGAGLANLQATLAAPSASSSSSASTPSISSFYEGASYSQGYGSHAFVESRRAPVSVAPPQAPAQAGTPSSSQRHLVHQPLPRDDAGQPLPQAAPDAAALLGGLREPPSTGDAALDAVCGTIRGIMARRGPKALYRLIAALAEASATRTPAPAPSSAYGAYGGAPEPAPSAATTGSLLQPLPLPVLTSVLSDESFGLSPAQLEVLASRLGEAGGGGRGAIVPARLLQLLHGPLPQGRGDMVAQAFELVARKAGLVPPSCVVPLEEVVMAFKSRSHPDVRSGEKERERVRDGVGAV